MKPLKFYLITDTHYFKNALGAFGNEYEAFMEDQQKCFAETQSINEAVFEYLTDAKEADILLIAGDRSGRLRPCGKMHGMRRDLRQHPHNVRKTLAV